MNLPELVTKLLLIERQLIEEGIQVNTVQVVIPKYDNETSSNYMATLNDISVSGLEVELNSY